MSKNRIDRIGRIDPMSRIGPSKHNQFKIGSAGTGDANRIDSTTMTQLQVKRQLAFSIATKNLSREQVEQMMLGEPRTKP